MAERGFEPWASQIVVQRSNRYTALPLIDLNLVELNFEPRYSETFAYDFALREKEHFQVISCPDNPQMHIYIPVFNLEGYRQVIY